MKQLHRTDLFGWSIFNEERNIDFHSVLWVRSEGNVAIDPLPLTAHDRKHLQSLGGIAHVVITNFDHIRAAWLLAREYGARVYGPAGDKELIPYDCDIWLEGGEEIVPGLKSIRMAGSKTPGELALLLENDTLVTGDLIRCHKAGELSLLPEAKLQDKALAAESVRDLAKLPGIRAVLTGDGWPVFNHGREALQHLAATLAE